VVEEGEELLQLQPAQHELHAGAGRFGPLRAILGSIAAVLVLAAVVVASSSSSSPPAATGLRPRSVIGANALSGKVMLQVSTLEVSEGGKSYKTVPVEFSKNSLDHDGAYVVDDGADVLLWIGKNAPRALVVEATKAAEEYVNLRGDKKRKVSIVFDGEDSDDNFREVFADTHNSTQMFRVLSTSTDAQAVEYEPVRAHVDSLESKGAYIVDPHNRTELVYLWFGLEVGDLLNTQATRACDSYIQASKWPNRKTAVIFEGDKANIPMEEAAFLKLLKGDKSGAATAGVGGFVLMLMLVLTSS